MAGQPNNLRWKKRFGGTLILAFMLVPLVLSYAWGFGAGLLFSAVVAGSVLILGNIFGNAATKTGIKANGLGFWFGGAVFAALIVPSVIGAGLGIVAGVAE